MRFLKELKIYLGKIQDISRERKGETYLQNILNSFDFGNSEINNFENIDLAIFQDKQIEVIIETKKPDSSEMISDENFAKKSFAQICYYYSEYRSSSIKHLIITDYKTLYIFKASEIEKIVSSKEFPRYRKSAKTGDIYLDILRNFDFSDVKYTKIDFEKFEISKIEELEKDLENLKIFELKRELTAIYKLLSPKNLLEIDAEKDMNSLDESFYQELLHIFGVEERKIDGIQKIVRKKERDSGSFLELTFLENSDLDFEKAFEINIIWLNRILFLKLLEARLVFMHPNFKFFMNIETLSDFQQLETLFFEIMAVEISERKPHLEKFKQIPYMNSSLFERKYFEEKRTGLCEIRNLNNTLEIGLFEKSILGSGKLKTLDYLFKFLDSYDFGSNKYQEVTKVDKTLIKSSVLGLIFEKVNGYKDGSHFTPSFITTKLAKDSLDRFPKNSLQNIKVLDPAVGSGHILVSLLNELVVRQAYLEDEFGNSKKISVDIENDEIFIADEEQYIKNENGNFPKEAIRIQRKMFHLKEKIIENNLFGVDINSKSVEIARLRLWIELLKWSYYDENGKFTTLPNIDINIKVGNSLLSRFEVKQKLEKKKTGELLNLVKEYISTKEKNQKKQIEKDIFKIKESFIGKLSRENSDIKKIRNLLDKYLDTFGEIEVGFWEKYTEKLMVTGEKTKGYKKDLKPILELHKKIEFLEKMPESFEWRFEFPEVLDENGDFLGFDLIVANPPYIRVQGLDREKSEYYKEIFSSAVGSYDIYVLFVEKFLPLLKDGGNLNFIMPHKWINSTFGKGLRGLVNQNISQFISFGEYLIFDNAMTYTSLLMMHKEKQDNLKYIDFVEKPKTKEERKDIPKEEKHDEVSQFLQNLKDDDFINIKTETLGSEPWIFKEKKVMDILKKLEEQPLRVSDIFERIFTGLQTSGDDIYLLECSEISENENCLECFSKEMRKREIEKPFVFEKEFLKPILKGNDVHRYEKLKNKFFVIFPYKFVDGKAELYSENEISEKFPESYKYLKFFEKEFRGRERGRLENDSFWFKYIYPKNLEFCQSSTKLVTPDITLGINLTFGNEFCLKSALYGLTIKEDFKKSLKFFLGILNSKLTWFFLQNTGTVLANGYFRFNPKYMNPFPLPKPTPESEKVLTNLVDYILFSKSNNLKKEANLIEAVIDIVVFGLYFEKEMKDANCYILDRLSDKLQPLKNFENLETKTEYINALYNFFSKDSKIQRSLIHSYKLVDEVKIINGK
ncbi:Eco57I restriction endonuclease [Thiovulum sp. ES]|nr:Eco57I restriction endonuclease [Thiovulum sp. ES]